MNAYQELQACIRALLANPELVSSVYADYNRLTETCKNPCGYNSFVPLGDISLANKEDFVFYLKKFVLPDENIENLSESELRKLYSTYTPHKTLQISDHSIKEPSNCIVCSQGIATNMCYYCGNGHCLKCPIQSFAFPQLSITDKHFFCSLCVDKLHQECTGLWIQKADTLIQNGSLSDIHASLGCLTMAAYTGGSCESMFKCLKSLYKSGHSMVALPLMINLIQVCTDKDLLVKARYFLANMLQFIARKDSAENSTDNLFFLLAAASAYEPESIYSECDSSIDLPNLPRLKQEVTADLDQRQASLLSNLKKSWNDRNWTELLRLTGKGSDCFIDVESDTVLTKFIAEKQSDHTISWDEQERYVFAFLRGKLSINQGKFSEGMELIEIAIWNHSSPQCLEKEAVALMIRILPNCLSTNNPKPLLNANSLLQGSTESIPIRIARLVFASDFDLEPPLKNLQARSLNLDHRMYKHEESILESFEKKISTKQKVAFEYVNLMQYSSNHVQNMMCHMLSALWYLQHLQGIPLSSTAERFATKKLITYLLKEVLLKTRIYHSHPGFQLYAATLVLKIMISILQTCKDIICAEDSELAIQSLSLVLNKCRMCPLWDTPIVLASEVSHISDITGKLHAQYLQSLEEVDTTLLPVKKSELMYHLYEHDLRRKERGNTLESPYLQKSMEELLKEHNWTFDDVTQRMTSPMDPRDSEGWLLPTGS